MASAWALASGGKIAFGVDLADRVAEGGSRRRRLRGCRVGVAEEFRERVVAKKAKRSSARALEMPWRGPR